MSAGRRPDEEVTRIGRSTRARCLPVASVHVGRDPMWPDAAAVPRSDRRPGLVRCGACPAVAVRHRCHQEEDAGRAARPVVCDSPMRCGWTFDQVPSRAADSYPTVRIACPLRGAHRLCFRRGGTTRSRPFGSRDGAHRAGGRRCAPSGMSLRHGRALGQTSSHISWVNHRQLVAPPVPRLPPGDIGVVPPPPDTRRSAPGPDAGPTVAPQRHPATSGRDRRARMPRASTARASSVRFS